MKQKNRPDGKSPEERRPRLENTFANRVKQFEQDEQRQKGPAAGTLPSPQASIIAQKGPSEASCGEIGVEIVNPYKRARLELLAKVEPVAKAKIIKMEKTGDLDNRIYNEFIAGIARLAEKYFSQN